jgi:hypothetical protein
MTVDDFAQQYPEYTFDFAIPIAGQPREYSAMVLALLPAELEPNHPYASGSRGRPNLNQTRAHSQCATCKRVLRNDFFYTLPSQTRRNVIYSHCRSCAQDLNAERYDVNSDAIRARRIEIWNYLAPSCTLCGFSGHSSALDLHHPGNKESVIAELITALTIDPRAGKMEALLRTAGKCVPLCSNCHRMLHAGALSLPAELNLPRYQLTELASRLQRLIMSIQKQ